MVYPEFMEKYRIRCGKNTTGICPIISITNAQNKKYWSDKQLYRALEQGDNKQLAARKRELKQELFDVVADQTGQLFDNKVLTIVWARRFAEYKRPALITQDIERFHSIITNEDRPVQFIWAGKPYPMDYNAISVHSTVLCHLSKKYRQNRGARWLRTEIIKTAKAGSDVFG
jgi:glycogen phosphorylase